MKEKLVKAIAAISATMMLFGMTAFAAPKTMSDGGTFDSEYYAQQNPDVVAALGTDENVLYQHYLNNGKAEGRLPYATGAANTSASASPSVVATTEFKYVSCDSSIKRYSQVINYMLRRDIATVQEMSDGTMYVSHSNSQETQVFAPTGEVSGTTACYKCIGSSSGKDSKDTIVYNRQLLGILNYSDSGTYLYSTLYAVKGLLD